jgi:hypothetical protein
LYVAGKRLNMRTLDATKKHGEVVYYHSTHSLVIGAEETKTIHLALSIDPFTDNEETALSRHLDYLSRSDGLQALVDTTLATLPVFNMDRLSALLGHDETLAFMVARNVDYLLNCCSVDVKDENGNDGGVCIITDHVCLPLGWNRDN